MLHICGIKNMYCYVLISVITYFIVLNYTVLNHIAAYITTIGVIPRFSGRNFGVQFLQLFAQVYYNKNNLN